MLGEFRTIFRCDLDGRVLLGVDIADFAWYLAPADLFVQAFEDRKLIVAQMEDSFARIR